MSVVTNPTVLVADSIPATTKLGTFRSNDLNITNMSIPFQLMNWATSGQNTQVVSSSILRALGRPSTPQWYTADAWLSETLSALRSFRGTQSGWDGENSHAPIPETLDAAEMLSAFFSEAPADRRPSVNVGPDGFPSFARNVADFYLHLVVEPRRHPSNCIANLTWYAIRNGEKVFEEGVPFDGTSLPKELSSLLNSDDL